MEKMLIHSLQTEPCLSPKGGGESLGATVVLGNKTRRKIFLGEPKAEDGGKKEKQEEEGQVSDVLYSEELEGMERRYFYLKNKVFLMEERGISFFVISFFF